MTIENAHIIDLSDDIDELLMLNLADVNGAPVIHLAASLKGHRAYSPEMHGILLNGMPMRFLSPVPTITELEADPGDEVPPPAPPKKKAKAAAAAVDTDATSDDGADAPAESKEEKDAADDA
jgi:hypothetical protein